jgi:hypothetical protein
MAFQATNLTADPNCPRCRVEWGRRQPNACRLHGWAYDNWLFGMRWGVSKYVPDSDHAASAPFRERTLDRGSIPEVR